MSYFVQVIHLEGAIYADGSFAPSNVRWIFNHTKNGVIIEPDCGRYAYSQKMLTDISNAPRNSSGEHEKYQWIKE
jgi:hypothetical protein